MLKQSFYIVAIQIMGIVLGFMSIYLVAGDMGPELYSLVGVHAVVSGIVLPFSHLGVETTMMREALYWMNKGEVEKVKEYTTQSLLSRLIGFAILFPIIIIYLLFLYFTKYQCQHLIILLSFYFGACASALNDSMSLIVRSQGDYVFSQAAKTINNSLVKFMAIFVYIKFGATPYLLFYCLIPIPLFFVFYFKIKRYLNLQYFELSGTIKKIKDSKNLWLKSYMDYFSNSADNFLVSLLFPPSVMGLYTLYKNFETIAKGFIEGFFDVIVQKFVGYKGNVEKLLSMEKKASIVRWLVVMMVVIFAFLFFYNSVYFITLVNLVKYEGVDYSILVVCIVSILYLIGKIETNLVSLMGPSKTILKLGVVLFFITIFSFVAVMVFPTIWGVYFQRIMVYGITSMIGLILFKRHRLDYYKNVYR